MPLQKTLYQLMQVEELLQQDQFAEHKCLYELHAAAWLVAHRWEDSNLLRKSAREMLFHLRNMYELTCLGGKTHLGVAAAEDRKQFAPARPSSWPRMINNGMNTLGLPRNAWAHSCVDRLHPGVEDAECRDIETPKL